MSDQSSHQNVCEKDMRTQTRKKSAIVASIMNGTGMYMSFNGSSPYFATSGLTTILTQNVVSMSELTLKRTWIGRWGIKFALEWASHLHSDPRATVTRL